MPKITNTRKYRASELLKRVKRGPYFKTPFQEEIDPTSCYRLWAESWVVDELIDLIPELRGTKNERKKSIQVHGN